MSDVFIVDFGLVESEEEARKQMDEAKEKLDAVGGDIVASGLPYVQMRHCCRNKSCTRCGGEGAYVVKRFSGKRVDLN